MSPIYENYPAKLQIDYSEKSDRFSVFFRIFMIIPILLILIFLTNNYGSTENHEGWRVLYYGPGYVFIPTLLMILFRQKYPKWWFNWNFELIKFSTRVFAYLLLLTDKYPSTDEEQSVHIEILYPDVEKDLHRGLPIVKWILVIPHIIVLFFLFIALVFTTIISWFIIVFSGKFPKGFFNFAVGILRWTIRVDAYAFLLVTDKYPPFSLQE